MQRGFLPSPVLETRPLTGPARRGQDGDLPVSRPKEDFQTGVAAIQNQCCGQSLAAGDKGVAGMYWFNDPPGSRDNVVLALAIPGTVTDLAPDTIVPNPSEYGMCVT